MSKLLMFLPLLFTASLSNAQNALLWKITGGNTNKPSYLFGTIHLIPKSDFFIPSGTEKALESCHTLIGEMDLSDMSGQMSGMMAGMNMKGDTTLKMLLSEQEYLKLDSFFTSKLGFPLTMFNTMKPLLLSALIAQGMPNEAEEMESYEMWFFDKARASNMKTRGLETAADQLGFIDLIPYKTQVKQLLDAMEGEEDGTGLKKMIGMYKAQDLDALHKEISESEGADLMEKFLLNNRNTNWVGLLQPIFKEGPVFVAVGAGHLPGPSGLIELLRKAGYKVQPVK